MATVDMLRAELERYREAEKEGRLPKYKIGDTVYILRRYGRYKVSTIFYTEKMELCYKIRNIGVVKQDGIFTDRASAEAAIKEQEDGD